MRSRARLAGVLTGALVLLCAAPAAAQDTAPAHQAWSSTQAADAVAAQPDDLVISSYAGQAAAVTYIALPDDAGEGSTVVLRMRAPETAPAVDAAAELLVCAVSSDLTADGQIPPDDAPETDCERAVATVPASTGELLVPFSDIAAAAGGPATTFALVARPRAPAGSVRMVLDATQTTVLASGSPTTEPLAPSEQKPPPPPAAPSPGLAPGLLDLDTGPPPLPGVPTAVAEPPPAVAAPAPAPELPATVPTAAPTQPEHTSVVSRALAAYLLLVALVVGALRPGRLAAPADTAPADTAAGATLSAVGWLRNGPVLAGAGLLAVPVLLSESAVYSVGLLLIAIVAAVGLHILVNWTGELSLAHAAFIGLPAFLAAQAAQSVGPVLALPVSVVAGVALGAVLGIPALRARGLYVALASLAVGAAVNSYLFTRTWLVGPAGGLDVPVPSVLGVDLDSSRALFPLLVVLVLLALASVRALYRSTLARSLMWVRDDAAAAAAYGIAANRHRAIGYCLAGAYAGLAGGLTVLWVQRLTAGTFPVALSFLYLLLVVLAGRGPLLGVVLAVLLLQGSQLFISGADSVVPYVGPVLLLLILTRFPAGLNGLSEVVMSKVRLANVAVQRPSVAAGTAAGLALVGLGVLAVGLAWYEAGSTDQLWIQNQYLLSGGVGGVVLVLIGLAAVVYTRVQRNHAELMRALYELAPRRDALDLDLDLEAAALPDQRGALR